MKFADFYQQLTDQKKIPRQLKILGEKKIIKGIAQFFAPGYGFDYIKISFSDHSALVVIPSQKNIGYSALGDMGAAEGITDVMIGRKELIYGGIKYKLDGANQYQFCTHVFIGQPGRDIEGECRFFDYVSEDGTKVLSLGWLAENNRRADVLAENIDINDVKILN